MLAGAVTGSSSSAAGSGAGLVMAGRGLTAASATVRGTEAASADLSAGLANGVVANNGFGFGTGIGSIAAVMTGLAAGGGVTAAKDCARATIAEDCLSGVIATSGGGAVVM